MRRKIRKIDNIMVRRVVTADIQEKVDDALDKMKSRGVRAIVVTQNNVPKWVLSRPIAASIIRASTKVSEITNKMERVKTVASGTLVPDTYDDLRRHRLLVVQDRSEKMIGVVSASDLIK